MAQSPPKFSHVGIFVHDLDRMASFYQRVLQLVETDRGHLPGRELVFLSSDPAEHHQVVFATGRTGEMDDKVINQISFRVDALEDVQAAYDRVLNDEEASDFRPINHGNAWTLYFRDPEQNRVEIFTDSPWYVAQPLAEPLDLSLPADEIRLQTEAMCRADPTFAPIAEWRSELAAKIMAARRSG